ncbi:Hypothetical predicted protein [Podarcis lilfordi]|uniref:Uncharacterized protein n=1 Tax=Podarcis lilfordi TaxID=74358 RepID=A0AA35KKK3_9SAUR|nr:Hypothetical predicted protein [Podarcis lilfordi]
MRDTAAMRFDKRQVCQPRVARATEHVTPTASAACTAQARERAPASECLAARGETVSCLARGESSGPGSTHFHRRPRPLRASKSVKAATGGPCQLWLERDAESCRAFNSSEFAINVWLLKVFKIMETKGMIGKPLQPARPARHLSSHVSATTFTFQTKFPCNPSVHLHNEISSMCKSNGMLVLNDSLIPTLSEQHTPEVTKERITYSRDFLLKLSKVSLAQKKPEFLPDHPIVLEKPKNYLLPTASNNRSF